jgi:hypothetical protein
MNIRRVAVVLVTLAFAGGARIATAQPAAERFEVAANLSVLRLSDFDATNAGVGGRVSFDLTKYAALEGELAFFPKDRIVQPASITAFGPFQIASERRRMDALFGLKVGTRGDRFGLFAKARPGITRLIDRGTACEGPGCATILMLIARNSYRTEFALDLGGGIELYPTARTVARFEMGDTLIRHRSSAPPCPASQCTSHNLSSRLGIGYRF